MSNQVVQTIKEAKIAEKVESGVSAVTSKLSDPALHEEVKQKAQAGWNWLSSSAYSLWSVAKDTVSSIAAEFAEPETTTGTTTADTAIETTIPREDDVM